MKDNSEMMKIIQRSSIVKKSLLKKKYNRLVAEIESAEMFDGRRKGVDVYVCEECGERFYTRYKDKGVTPFTIKCRNCEHGTAFHKETIAEHLAGLMDLKIHNWVRPTFMQLVKLSEGAQEHVLNGGLILEDEIYVPRTAHHRRSAYLYLFQREKMNYTFRSTNRLHYREFHILPSISIRSERGTKPRHLYLSWLSFQFRIQIR